MYSENDIPFIPILIASQHSVFSQNLYSNLSQQKEFNIVGTMHPAKAGKHFHQTGWTTAGQDLVLVWDISSPLSQAVQLLADWHAQQPSSKTLLVSDALPESFMLEALRYGARGFMVKTCPLETYVKAIRVMHAGDFWIRRKTLVHLLQTFCQAMDAYPFQEAPDPHKATANTHEDWDCFAQPAPENNPQQTNTLESSLCPQGQAHLTNREQEIVHYVARGLSNKEIANQMGVSDKTVKTHLHSIFSKLQVSRRMDLVLPQANYRYG